MTDDRQQLEELRRRWDKEWGPELQPWQRRLSGIVILVLFFGILFLAFSAVR